MNNFWRLIQTEIQRFQIFFWRSIFKKSNQKSNRYGIFHEINRKCAHIFSRNPQLFQLHFYRSWNLEVVNKIFWADFGQNGNSRQVKEAQRIFPFLQKKCLSFSEYDRYKYRYNSDLKKIVSLQVAKIAKANWRKKDIISSLSSDCKNPFFFGQMKS